MIAGHLQEKNGYWYVVLNYKHDGKKVVKWFSTKLKVHGNKKRAEEILISKRIEFTNMLENRNLPELKPREKGSKEVCKKVITMEALCESWLAHKKPQIQQTTYIGYSRIVKDHILKYVRKNPCDVKDVDTGYVVKYIDACYASGLSHKTIKNHRGVLTNMFLYAMLLGEIKENPLDRLEKAKQTPPVENYYSAETLIEVLKSVQGTKLEYPVYMACIYGLRRSEVCGLKWSAIDFKNNLFTTRHTVTEMSAPGLKPNLIIKDETKNKKNKSFPLIQATYNLLSKIKLRQEELGIYQEDGYVYIWDDGRLVKPQYITKAFSQHLKKHGFKHVRFHDLRHSCASALISDQDRSISLKDIQIWLGHSNIQSTMRYAHLADVKAKAHTANIMEDILFNETIEKIAK